MDTSIPGTAQARIGIVGGSGTYGLPAATVRATLTIRTPYGPPSGPVTLADVGGRTVAFLPRHGHKHSLPPQKINYRANLWALKSLGVEAVLSSSAVGGLRRGFGPETFVVTDQLIDRTWGRDDTFFDGTLADGATPAGVQHLPASEPFCPTLRSHLEAALAAQGLSYAPRGTVVVINGPRFSTKAESQWYVSGGADIISMTQYPEPVLAAELNMGFANLAFITDSDTGHDGSEPVTADAVFARLKKAQHNVLAVLEDTIAAIAEDYIPRPLMDRTAVARIMALPAAPDSESVL
ncbi:5'-methylthioadenosine phosphorylase [Arthrobacter sp. 49Tsu3.1M3]|jgi:5'-methylthioadenosine phosphorylase|uniref:MTAP family purine nucleoside phosphorylase n=1 Tax=Arthrobacter sp. 49Tsu3.1M3 TaxID=1279029 RepID=UPI0009A8F05F|nr:MTAP family purine nucleoside phosphorylase [Arthrobacter sp. 49Tsu3.1M3]SKB40311.1 5'-methylthioadenosine phosphorylase [Arthrobacter sp. 49Tsu3.1M3]